MTAGLWTGDVVKASGEPSCHGVWGRVEGGRGEGGRAWVKELMGAMGDDDEEEPRRRKRRRDHRHHQVMKSIGKRARATRRCYDGKRPDRGMRGKWGHCW